MGQNSRKFLLLLWKNWVLAKRRWKRTLAEILIPVLICLLLLVVRNLIDQELKGPITYPEVTLNDYNLGIPIHYSPSNAHITTILENNGITAIGVKDSIELENTLLGLPFFERVGIQFDDKFSDANYQNFDDLKVVIRLPSEKFEAKKDVWYTNMLYPMLQLPGPRDPGDQTGGDPNYYGRGFLKLQNLITRAFANIKTGVFPNLVIHRFSYPTYTDDPFYNNTMENMVTMLVMISFMYNFINIVRAVTAEKEQQLKESMKIMGLPGWLHWLAWFIRSFAVFLISAVLITIIVKIPVNGAAVFSKSDGSLLFVFFLIFGCATITFAFCVTVFFSKANTATAVGGIGYFVGYLPYSIMVQQQQTQQSGALGVGSRLGASLLTNSGLSYGISIILKFEAIEAGAQWSTLFTPVTSDDPMTFGYIILMLIFDMCFYLLIAIYVEAIFPGEFGVPQKFYFPFTKQFWSSHVESMDVELSNQLSDEYFEEMTERLPAGIQLKCLSKKFGANTAVNELSLDMYEGHITVLLGHNGAGKTTTMSMITGMIPPTQGTAIVSGYDVRINTSKVRDSMGMCLQHNVLFDDLTVSEHLYFFSKLKGLNGAAIQNEVNTYIKLLDFEDKRFALSSSLSGGMKRKLSVGVSLCGDSKVVMLDEPTAGMDPSARRVIWELLQEQKKNRTILLTTHFMDEADLLGDRIAIMSDGKLQCVGSSFFLKRKYGAGYYLIMDVSQNCHSREVTKLLQSHIPSIKMESHIGSELSYLLSEEESHKFENMLLDLETNIKVLGINSYGISLTTLEEVFMKVGADHLNEADHKNNDAKITMENAIKSDLVSDRQQLVNQFYATFLKKYLSQLRSYWLSIIQVVLPVVLILISILSGRGNLPDRNFPALEMTLDRYDESITLIEGLPSWTDIYKQAEKNQIVKIVNDLDSIVYKETEKDPGNVKLHYIIGATLTDEKITAWFNGDPYHSTPLSVGLALNVAYKKALDNNNAQIQFVNHPLPFSVEAEINDLQFNIAGVQIALQIGYVLAFVSSFYTLLCIKERISKAKHLQFVSGMNIFVYWSATLLFDIFTYILTCIPLVITIIALQEEGFTTGGQIGRLILLLLCFGCFAIPFIYICSFRFPLPSTGFSRILLLGAISCTAGLLIVQVLEVPDLNLLYVAKPLHWVLLFTPFYPASKGIADCSTISSYAKICAKIPGDPCSNSFPELKDICCNFSEDYFAFTTPGIGRNVLFSLLMGIILFGFLLMWEYNIFTRIISSIKNVNKTVPEITDLEEDVLVETNKIRQSDIRHLQEKYTLILKDLSKYYGNFLAVNNLCLGVSSYECFGLLGVNGAGKTTTFKMMTGDEDITQGDVFINGINLRDNLKEVQKYIGYCPQFDALLDDLTARETLRHFGLIRGVADGECNDLAEYLAHEFDFYRHLDKQVKQLSGGNKRKLSTALALIGDPPIIYLDEPTAGMDPATKRYLWQALCKLRDRGKCIVLTSHSMEECEALCTRIAIMVNGSFKCLGSTQRLKNKFAQGYALTIKLKKHTDSASVEQEVAHIESFVREQFPNSELKEKHQMLLTYFLAESGMPWSKMFGILERSKRRLNIEDYSLGQCSLEQVFLTFTKYQHGE